MALRGKAPEAVKKRLKALFFGPAGVGKTTAAIQFPKPYLIDTEKGAENEQYVKLLRASGGAYFFTADFEEMLSEVTSLLSESHEYQTVIIDPLTVVYNDLLDKSAKSLATREDPAGTAFGRHKAPADRKLKHLLNLLLRLDMNVIITSHAKTMWERVGTQLTDAGQTFDCYAKLDYLFDLVFELQKRGADRVGVVRKTRIDGFPEGESFPFNYAEIAKRYGKDVLEKKAKPEVLATPEQVAEADRLAEAASIPHETLDKWFEKAGATHWGEMPQDIAQKCIEHMKKIALGEAKKEKTNAA